MRGATEHVYRTIRRNLDEGRPAVSLLDLSVESGYSLPAVALAVRRLEQMQMITVERGGAGRPNRYALADPQPLTHVLARVAALL